MLDVDGTPEPATRVRAKELFRYREKDLGKKMKIQDMLVQFADIVKEREPRL